MKNWEECNLEDYIKLIDYRGRTPVKTESGVRLITAKNVKLGYLQLEPQEFIATENYDSWMSRGIPNYGDVIFTTEAPLANVAQIDTNEKLAFAQRIIVMQPNPKKIDQTFLKWMLLSENTRQKILEKGTGATVTGIKSSLLKKIRISFPPLPEQKRIVSILDKCFAAIDKAKANAEQNLKNAKELFESYLQGVFERKSLNRDSNDFPDDLDVNNQKKSSNQANQNHHGSDKGDGWEEKRFDEVCVLQRGFDLPTHSRFEGEFPLVSSNGITDSINQWKVKAPGVVTGRSGTIGNVHFIEEDFWPLNTALYIKNFHGNDERFIYYFLTSFDLSKYSSGAGVPTLNRNNVHSVNVSVPKSKETQQTIVRQLDALRAETQKLEAVYQKKIADLDELKKSILQKAFAGELRGGEPVEPKTKKAVAV
jgi:type I restriction enzyme S subunit